MACSRAKQCCCKRSKDNTPAWKQQSCLNGCRLAPAYAPVAPVVLSAVRSSLELHTPAEPLLPSLWRLSPPAESVPYSQRQRPPPTSLLLPLIP